MKDWTMDGYYVRYMCVFGELRTSSKFTHVKSSLCIFLEIYKFCIRRKSFSLKSFFRIDAFQQLEMSSVLNPAKRSSERRL